MPTNQPWGDIYQAGTPALDKLGQQFYNQQMQRDLYLRQQNKAMNDEFSRNMSNMRDADIGKLTDAYNDYKTAVKTGIQQRNNVDPKQQMDILQKKAKMYQIIEGSKLKAADEKRMAGLLGSDKTGEYRDDAYQTLQQGRQLPYDAQLPITDPKTGQKTNIDWTNPDDLKRHIDVKGVFDAIDKATGKPQNVAGDRYKNNPTDLQWQQPEIVVKNKPLDFYNSMRLSATKDPADFANTLPHPTPEEYYNVQQNYNQLMQDPKVRQMWKIGDGEELPPDDNLSDIEKQIKYEAMSHAIMNQPKISKISTVIDQDLKTQQSQAFQLKKQAIGHQNSLENIRLGASLRGNDPAVINQNVTGLIATQIANSKQTDGEVPMSPQTFKAITGDVLTNRTVTKVDDNGNFTYGKRELDADGKPTGKILNPKTVPYNEAVVGLTKAYKSGLSGNYNQGSTKPPVAQPTNIKQTYKLGDKTITIDQVRKGAKKYNLTIDEYIKQTGLQ